MKILHTVESYLPSRHGMQEVVMQLSENLAKLGHQVTIATSFNNQRASDVINNIPIVSFKISGNAVLGIKGESSEYQEFLKNSDFDVITNFAAQQWATDLALPVLKEIKAKKVFVPTGFSALQLPAYSDYFNRMKAWMLQYDANVFLAENYRDINFAKANKIPQLFIIPNGASKEEFADMPFTDIRKLIGVSDKTRLILTVGNHTGYKGHKEAIDIFRKAKIENASLLIIGKAPAGGTPVINLAKSLVNLAGMKRTNCSLSCKLKAGTYNALNKKKCIVIKEMDRALTVNAFRQADLFLFPSMIECSPIVLFEALAAATPFLVGDVGNSKEIIDWTGGGELLPTKIDQYGFSHARIKESAALLSDLLNNGPVLEDYSRAGNRAFTEKFTWSKIAAKYEDLYQGLVENVHRKK